MYWYLDNLQFDKTVSVKEQFGNSPEFNIYPNPISNKLYVINNTNQVKDLGIYSNSGNYMGNIHLRPNESKHSSVEWLSRGLWFIVDRRSGQLMKMIKN